MSDTYKVVIEEAAWEELMQLDAKAQATLLELIEGLEKEPRPGNSKRLKGDLRDYWRVRKGDYRVIYTIEDGILQVVVVKVGNRKDVYE